MVKNLIAIQETQETCVRSLDEEDPLKEDLATYSIVLSGESYGQRSLVTYSPEGCKESDMTEVVEHACTHNKLYILQCIIYLVHMCT